MQVRILPGLSIDLEEKRMSWKFKEGFEIRTRRDMLGFTFQAMGETHIAEGTVFDVFVGSTKVGTRECYEDAKALGIKLTRGMETE